MRIFNVGAAGVVAGTLFFGSVGSVSAQNLFEADPADLQFERDVRSTYIVRLASELPSQAVNNRANEVAARFGGRIRYVYTNALNGFAITMPSVAMARMTEAGGLDIISVTRDGIVTIDVKPDAPGGGKGKPPKDDPPPEEGSCDQELPWGVARVTDMTISDDGCDVTDTGFESPPNYGGTAPAVCVIDTGVDRDHEDLNVSDVYFNAIGNESHDDLHGHGSHVAGTIGALANDVGVGVIGVAPGANIVSVKVLNRRGSGSYSGVIDGVDWVAGNETDCAVANMSLGGSVYEPLDTAILCAASTALDKYPGCPKDFTPRGVTFTLAAGNSGDNAFNHSPARIGGASDNVHTIAAMATLDAWIYFSNWGDPVGYIEPGVSIPSTFKNGGYKTYSGTSMAAPHMAGLILRSIVNHDGSTSAFTTDGTVTGDKDGRDYLIAVSD